MKMISSRLAASAALAILPFSSGCAAPVAHSAGFAPTAPQSGAKQRVTLKIKIPKKAKAAAARHRRGRYVSPATTQMVVDVESGCPGSCASLPGYPETVPLTPSSTGCSSTLATTYCQVAFELPPGSYVVSLTAQDAQHTALSTVQNIAFGVTAGAANTLAVTLSGIPKAIVAASIGAGTAYVAEALDADGNIIAGPGSPTFTVARTGGSFLTVKNPSPTAPNTFYAYPMSAGSATIAINARYSVDVTDGCAQSGAQCTGSYTLTSTPNASTMFVSSAEGVSAYAAPYTGPAVATLINFIVPFGIAVDSQGDLFVVDASANTVSEFAPPYTGGPIATVGGFRSALFIAVDSHDNLFVSDGSDRNDDPFTGIITKFAPPYTSGGTTILTGLNQPTGIAFDSSENLFVAFSTDAVAREYAPPAYASPFAQTSGNLNDPYGVAVDANDNVYIANLGSDSFARFVPFPTFEGPTTATAGHPVGVALDPSGNLYVSSAVGHNVQSFASPYDGSPTTVQDNIIDTADVTFYGTYTTTIAPGP